MADSAARRIARLGSHLRASAAPGSAAGSHASSARPKPNVRPGDDGVSAVETSFFVQDHFTPVSEEAVVPIDLQRDCIEGNVPRDLVGRFMRIGGNPQFEFEGKPYHPFDGDGMIHSVTLAPDGSATYQNRWVRTKVFEKEKERGFSFSFMGEAGAISQTGNLSFTQHIDPADVAGEVGRANTAMVWHEPTQRVLALFEGDVPYAVDLRTLETFERVRKIGDQRLKYTTFTAHPKVHPLPTRPPHP